MKILSPSLICAVILTIKTCLPAQVVYQPLDVTLSPPAPGAAVVEDIEDQLNPGFCLCRVLVEGSYLRTFLGGSCPTTATGWEVRRDDLFPNFASLVHGDPIGAAGTYVTGAGGSGGSCFGLCLSPSVPPWHISQTDRYVGFRFYRSGSAFYGWLHLDVILTGTQITTVQLHGLAYQSQPFTPIHAGEVTGAFRTFGSGCGGLDWIPAGPPPKIGATASLQLTGASNPLGSIGLSILGLQQNTIDLSPLGAPGCALFVEALDLQPLFPLSNGSTNATFAWPIPNANALVGLSVWTQGAVVLPPGTNALNLQTTAAVELIIGNT